MSSNSALQYVNYPTQVSLLGGAELVCKPDSFQFIHVGVVLTTVSVVSGVGKVLQTHPRSV